MYFLFLNHQLGLRHQFILQIKIWQGMMRVKRLNLKFRFLNSYRYSVKQIVDYLYHFKLSFR